MQFVPLINNLTLLLILTIPYRYISRRWGKDRKRSQILIGIVFGMVAMVGMSMPMHFAPGVFFDARSVFVSVGSLFGGPIAAVLISVVASVYRFWLGGMGALRGVLLIVASALIGVGFYYLRRKQPGVTQPLFLLGFGLLVHVVMLILMASLPSVYLHELFANYFLPVLVVLPVGTVLLGKMLADEEAYVAANDVLRESEERFRATFEQAAVGIVHANLDGRFVLVNQRLCDMVGYSHDEMLERTFQDITHPDDLEVDLENVEQVLADEIKTFSMEKRYIRKDGSVVWVNLTVSLVREVSGAPKYFIGVIEDITERRQMQTELIRTQRLRALGELSAGVSHNLNNILTGILGPAQLLQLSSKDAETLAEAERIIAAARRARDLVHHLHLSTRGIEDHALESVEINDIIREAVDTTRPRWKDEPEARGVTIEVVTDLDDVAKVGASEFRLHDILLNLLLNAVDAMPEGGQIFIQTHRVEDTVQMIVRDTGIGMDEETRLRIFEPFFTTKVDIGSGLGLATVYATMTRWGGRVDVESTPGDGTAFILSFPIWQT